MAAAQPSGAEILDGVWQFTAVHPEWEDDSDGWEPEVNWWAIRTPDGLVLVDPLVTDWVCLDELVTQAGGCAAIVRTTYWHERTIATASERFGAEIWARPPSDGATTKPFDRAAEDGSRLPGGLEAIGVVRDDEIALWLPEQRALVFGDVMIRSPEGELTMCPESWVERDGGHPALREALAPLAERDIGHVLVAHGPLVLSDGPVAFARAIAE